MGCGEQKPKKELIRVVRSPEGDISIDFTGKKSGRGAYICPDGKCLAKAVRSKRLEKSLSCEIPDSVYGVLAEEINAGLICYDCGHYLHYYKSDEMSAEIRNFCNSFR